ncbi:MAG: hypothetical protein ACFB10_19070, partial [Salibacteraceae bacterium]
DRIIPLGTLNDQLLAFEVLQQRYGGGEHGFDPYWRVEVRVVRFLSDHSAETVKAFPSEKDIPGNQLHINLQDKLKQAFSYCRELKGFDSIQAERISFCDFQRECRLVSLVEKGAQIQIEPKGSKNGFPVLWIDSASNYRVGLCCRERNKNYDITLPGSDLLISSVRLYTTVSGKRLLVMQLQTGHQPEPADPSLISPPKEQDFTGSLTSVKSCFFEEPLLHHGCGFDYFVWL